MSTPEDLYRKQFEGFGETPPPGLWKNIRWRLALNKFLKPGFRNFNIYYLAAITAAGAYLGINTIGQDVDASNTATPTEIHSPIVDNKSANNTNIVALPEKKINNPKLLEKATSNNDEKLLTDTPNNIVQATESTPDKKTETHQVSYDHAVASTSNTEFSCAFATSTRQGCPPLTIRLRNMSQNTDYCQWDLGNGETSYDLEPIVRYDNPGTYIITLKTVNGTNAKTVSDTIIVYNKPHAEIAVAASSLTVVAEARNTNASTIKWYFGDGSSTYGKKRAHKYSLPGNYNISLVVGNNTCTDSVSKYIAVNSPEYKLVFPNAIMASKSGSLDNDYNVNQGSSPLFRPNGNTDKIVRYSLKIYNRNGKEIFSTTSPLEGWNGYYNGEPMPTGVYVYSTQYEFENGEKNRHNGNITLLWE
jgi:gliding motility-associated-like protein